MSELSATMDQAFAELDGNTGAPPTPAPQAETPPAPRGAETPDQTSPPKTETPAETGEAEFLGEKFDWSKVPPEQLAALKGFQASYTKKMQEVAEQRKQYEQIDQGSLQWLQYLQSLASTNPAAAAELLKRQAEQLAGTPQQKPDAPDPFELDEYRTPNEQRMAQILREQREELQRVQAAIQQQEQARARADIDRRFSEIESQYGVKLPFEERQKVCAFCVTNGLNDVAFGWKAMNYDRAVQMGRDEASRVVQQKVGIVPPATVANREGETGPREPRNTREALEMAFSEAGQ